MNLGKQMNNNTWSHNSNSTFWDGKHDMLPGGMWWEDHLIFVRCGCQKAITKQDSLGSVARSIYSKYGRQKNMVNDARNMQGDPL